MLINVFIHRTSIIYCAIHINAYITWGMMLIHTSPASWFLFFVVLQWEVVLIAWCQSDDVWGSMNNNKNTVTQTASTEMLTLVSPGILSFGEVEGELARGETSLLSSARGWTAAAGVETKKCTYIWMLRRQETVHLILHLKMGFFFHHLAGGSEMPEGAGFDVALLERILLLVQPPTLWYPLLSETRYCRSPFSAPGSSSVSQSAHFWGRRLSGRVASVQTSALQPDGWQEHEESNVEASASWRDSTEMQYQREIEKDQRKEKKDTTWQGNPSRCHALSVLK